jgi:hypothetical protein
MALTLIGAFKDGSLLVQRGTLRNMLHASDGLQEDTAIVTQVGMNGAILARSAPVVLSCEDNLIIGGADAGRYQEIRWISPVFKAVGCDRLYIADSRTFEVRVIGPDGKLERIVRAAAPRVCSPAPCGCLHSTWRPESRSGLTMYLEPHSMLWINLRWSSSGSIAGGERTRIGQGTAHQSIPEGGNVAGGGAAASAAGKFRPSDTVRRAWYSR